MTNFKALQTVSDALTKSKEYVTDETFEQWIAANSQLGVTTLQGG